jgi:hypothetical protein
VRKAANDPDAYFRCCEEFSVNAGIDACLIYDHSA